MTNLFQEIVSKRGLSSDFLNPKYLSDPKCHNKLPDMKKAITRIAEAISKRQKVMVYGDYDVDGVTATTVMVSALKMAGLSEVSTMLPDRFIDGYGMSKRSVERAKADGIDLIITVDCGSNNAEVISELNEAGVDVIVTDHHEVMADVPEALAVVNPKRTDISEAAKKKIIDAGLNDLAGVGVAFMVARGLVEKELIKEGQEKWLLDLVLIGTLCDSMELSKTNRELTYYGLKVLAKTKRVGLIELMKVAKTAELTAEAIGFQIGPRLNAGGRMESAELSLELLLTDSRVEAVRLADELNTLNMRRRDEQQAAMLEIETKVEELSKPVIVVTGSWHEGVLGIIAGRLVEKYHKPAFVLSKVEVSDEDGDGIVDIYKGSGRSFGEFDLAEALRNLKSIYSGGGHAGACGLKVLPEKIKDFSEEVNEYYESLMLEDQGRFFGVESEVRTSDLSEFKPELLNELRQLEPFGTGNEEPIIELTNVEIVESRGVGKDEKHLRMIVERDGSRMTLVAFSAPKRWFKFQVGELVDVKIKLLKNEWNGRVSVEGRILEIQGCIFE